MALVSTLDAAAGLVVIRYVPEFARRLEEILATLSRGTGQ